MEEEKTPEEFDIHDRKGQYDSALKVLNESDIGQRNKDLILEYAKHRELRDNIGITRRAKYLFYLRVMADELKKDFDKADKKDIENLWYDIKNRDTQWGKHGKKRKLSKWSLCDYCTTLKSFYRWLETPELVDWLKPPKGEIHELTVHDIITWEDVITLSNAAMNPRDRALVQVLWDTGLRIEELLTLRIKSVERVNKGSAVKLHVEKSKTKRRSPLIVRSAPALLHWIDYHPRKNDKESPLWCKVIKPHSLMDYDTARKILRDLKTRSGLDKPINPHNFRKSSASFYSHFLSPSELKNRFGWNQSSRMLDIYCFPDEDKINDKILVMHGLKSDKEDNGGLERETKPEKCQWCGRINPAGQEYCVICKRPLNPEESLITSSFIENTDREIKDLIDVEINTAVDRLRVKMAKEIRSKMKA